MKLSELRRLTSASTDLDEARERIAELMSYLEDNRGSLVQAGGPPLRAELRRLYRRLEAVNRTLEIVDEH